ncbi:polyamine-transporting ATPase 13A3 isoform X2 [Petromyzon marinus]|uniref:polyamine-transporting ATPase 13A3 isoform X2 n=1 Tax=Petromyzon marinus TaxID=7757 RepID=UPI003F715329
MGSSEKDETVVNEGKEDEMEVHAFRWCAWRLVLVGVGAVCTGGLLLLALYWLPRWNVRATCSRCSLQQASILLLRTTDEFSIWYRVKVRHMVSSSTNQKPLSMGADETDDIIRLLSPTSSSASTEHEHSVRYFAHHFVKYLWDPINYKFIRLRGLEEGVPLAAFYSTRSHGLHEEAQQHLRTFYEENQIAVKVPSHLKLLFKEVLNPFYIFQAFSVALWMSDEYYYYASAIVIMSFISIGTSLYSIRKQYLMLHDMVEAHNVVGVVVCRPGKDPESILSTELVPGDVMVIPPGGTIMPCDGALISGSCIVNESMLTGESVPVTKTSLPHPVGDATGQDEVFDAEAHKRHVVFCGTHVVQTRFYSGESVRVVVVRTGFGTAKGQLVRSILYPKPTNVRLYRDAFRFLLFLVAVALVGFVYTVISSTLKGEKASKIVVEALDIITITVPPALPAALTAGVVYAQQRLKRAGIFCLSPNLIQVSGHTHLVCFDKTGTLTEDGLDMWGVIPVENNVFSPVCTEMSHPELVHTPLLAAMATCHSLTRIDGQLTGDPLDLNMFNATGWVLEEATSDENAKFDTIMPTVVRPACNPNVATNQKAACDADSANPNSDPDVSGYEIGVVREFPFSSELQRMSVVTRTLSARCMHAYSKGAPETIMRLCVPASVPKDFAEVLEQHTRQGYRVIALAHRALPHKLNWHRVQQASRDTIESGLQMLGLIVMQNKLKPETEPVLQQLKEARIRTVMVTGDNLLTAMSVARDCGMVNASDEIIVTEATPPGNGLPATITWHPERPISNEQPQQGCVVNMSSNHEYHFAMSGKSFAIIFDHFPDLLPKIVLRGTIFARMSPDQKTQLIEVLQGMDYCVGMCGDGANDCGALKRAHAGISLSELEASVASPFTSKTPNISCVPTLIREGRAALITSFCVFKFMALYSIIQYLSVLLLYSILSNLGDFQFLFIDLAIILVLAFTIPLNGAWPQLTAMGPPSSLLSVRLLLSVAAQALTCLGVQVCAFLLTQRQPWYQPWAPNITLCPGEETPLNSTDWVHDENNIRNAENTTLFFVSSFQYIIVCFVFAKGKPYRQPIYKNRLFVAGLIILPAFLTFLMFYRYPGMDDFFELICIPMVWRCYMLGFVAANLVISVLLEASVVTAASYIESQQRTNLACDNTNQWAENFLQRTRRGDRQVCGNPRARAHTQRDVRVMSACVCFFFTILCTSTSVLAFMRARSRVRVQFRELSAGVPVCACATSRASSGYDV